MELFVVGLGGFLGSCARFLLTKAAGMLHWSFPLGTLCSNVLAGLLIGFLIGLDRGAGIFSPRMRLFLTTGCLGGLSTFSTFSMETVDLFLSHQYPLAVGNIILNLALSLLGVAAGLALSGLLLKRI